MIIAAVDFLSGLVSDKFFSIAKNKSSFGGLCSLLFVVILIIGIERSCTELFSRNNPSTQSSTQMNENPREIVVTPDVFPLSFYLGTPAIYGSTPFINDNIYTMNVYHMIIYDYELPNGTVTRLINTTKLETEQCTAAYAGEYAYKFEDMDFSGSRCIKANQGVGNFTLEGRFSRNTYQAFAVTVSPCNRTAPGNTCELPEVIAAYLTGAWFTVGYFNHLPTLQNYEKPLDYYIDDHTTIITPGAYKQLFIEVGYVAAQTDSGFVFGSYHNDTSYKVSSITEYNNPTPSLDGTLIMCLIQSGQEETYYTRSYKKFQSTLSDIGGLANAVLGIILIVATPYLKFKARENLMNEVFTIKEEPKVIKPKKQKPKPEKKKKNKMQSSGQTLNTESAHKYQEQKGMLSGIGMLSMESNASPTREDFPLKLQYERRILSLSSSLNRIPESPKIKKKENDLELIKAVSSDPLAPGIGPTEPAKATQEEEKQDKSDIENQIEYRQRKVEIEDMTDVKFDESPIKTKPDKFRFETAGPNNNNNNNNNQSETQSNNNPPEIKENQITLVYKHDNSKKKIRQKQKQKRVHLKFWEYLMSLICKPKSIRHKIETVQAGVDNVHQRLELNNILKKLSEVDKLISLLLDSDQLELFNSIPKPQIYLKRNLPDLLRKNSFERNLHHKASLAEGPQDENNMVKAYNKLKNKENKTELDKRLIYIFNEAGQ